MYVEWWDGRIAVAVVEVGAMEFGLTGKVGGRVRSTQRAKGGIFGNDGYDDDGPSRNPTQLWRSHCVCGEGGVAERRCPRRRLRFRVWAEVCRRRLGRRGDWL